MKLKRKASKKNNEPAIETTSSVKKKKKKQRTKLTRKLRSPISPVLLLSKPAPNLTEEDNGSTCTHLLDEHSSFTIPEEDKKKNWPREEKQEEKEENDELFRRNTRSNNKKRNDVVSFASNSAAESCLSSLKTVEKKQLETDQLSLEASTKNNNDDVVSDLACQEKLVEDNEDDDDVVSDYYCLCDDYYCSSSLDPSEYTPSLFLDSSGSEFSTGAEDHSPPSRTSSILLEFRNQFFRSSSSLAFDSRRSSVYQSECRFVRFENVEDEEAYERLRERERRQVMSHDYGELYRSTTDYGYLIVEQRSLMVHWIAEHSEELQPETMFLGISLLDRFLSKGFFKTKRNLQLAGIACLTLATRIEENQPYNSVRRKSFHIGSNMYSRYEVVAMEWLVQEVLNFQCFSPTIYNFLWFYLKAAGADPVLEKRAKYLAVLATSDHEQLGHWPSTVAAAIVILASLESNQIAIYQRVIEIHVRTKENDLHESIKSLEWLLQFAT